jgi:hypothetical protein
VAIIGTLIDKTTVSRAGDALVGVTLATLAHSLPATNPTIVLPVLRSVQGIAAQAPVQVLGLGGNASIATIGFAAASAASTPTVMFDVYTAVVHSLIS